MYVLKPISHATFFLNEKPNDAYWSISGTNISLDVLFDLQHVLSVCSTYAKRVERRKKKSLCVNVSKYLVIISLINLRISRKDIVIIIG